MFIVMLFTSSLYSTGTGDTISSGACPTSHAASPIGRRTIAADKTFRRTGADSRTQTKMVLTLAVKWHKIIEPYVDKSFLF